MNFEQALKDFEAVTDDTALVQPFSGKSGNGILATCQTAIILNDKPFFCYSDKFLKLFWAVCLCQIEPGLFRRHTKHFTEDQESVDDYLAISCAVPLLCLSVLDFAKKGWKIGNLNIPWYFPNEKQYQTKFSFRAWLYRFPALVCQVKQACGVPAAFWQRWVWAFSVMTCGWFGGNPDDSWILSWMMVNCLTDRSKWSWSQRTARKVYFWRLKRAGGIKVFFTRFYGENHPITKYAKDRYGN